ncbi:MAG: Vitamin B12 import ATP-binding protein BtuD [Methanoregula sp. SKADARSKE-2]|nr:MAG: Vitamin B12 import ATP-binding protein BtuD [Methanoregula sp. SKADARSKE-2]
MPKKRRGSGRSPEPGIPAYASISRGPGSGPGQNTSLLSCLIRSRTGGGTDPFRKGSRKPGFTTEFNRKNGKFEKLGEPAGKFPSRRGSDTSLPQMSGSSSASDFVLHGMVYRMGTTGERHRVALAQVLIKEPRLVILDEPTGTMDPITKQDVKHSILNARDEMDETFIIVSHDMDFVRDVCDRVALMRGGKMIDIGPTAAVLAEVTDDERERTDFAERKNLNATRTVPAADLHRTAHRRDCLPRQRSMSSTSSLYSAENAGWEDPPSL